MAMATISDALGLRIVTGPNKQTLEVPYKIFGATNATDALAALTGGTSLTLGSLLRLGVDARESETGNVYDGTVTYEFPDAQPKQTGQTAFTFDTSGGTQKIIHNLATQGSWPQPGGPGDAPAYDPQGMINASAEGVAGVDITVAQFAFTVTVYEPATNVTESYISNLYGLTGRVNGSNVTMLADGIPMSFQAGELLALGSRGARRGQGDVEISHSFAFSPNLVNISIGDGGFLVEAKAGWDYLEIVTMSGTFTATLHINGSPSSATLVRATPVAAVVHKVYRDGDFTHFNVPTS